MQWTFLCDNIDSKAKVDDLPAGIRLLELADRFCVVAWRHGAAYPRPRLGAGGSEEGYRRVLRQALCLGPRRCR